MGVKMSEWRLKMTENVQSVMSKLNGVADSVAARFAAAQDKIAAFNSKIKDAANEIPGLGRALGLLSNPVALGVAGAVALGAGFVQSTKAAGAFKQEVAELSAITGFVGSDLEHLSNKALEMGAKSGLGANRAVEAYKLLASNIDVASIGGVAALDELQEKTITLSQAAGVDLPTAANTMAATINQFGFEAKEASRVINTLAAGAKFGAAEIPDLAESLKIAGTSAAIAGVSVEQTVGALEILSQSALKGSEAGTGLRNVLVRLQTKDIPGVDLKTQGLSGALAKLQPKLKDTAFLAEVFGRENLNAAQILIKNAGAVQEMTDKVTGTNIAYEQAATQTNTYQGAMDRLRAATEVFFIKVGSQFLPAITRGLNIVAGTLIRITNWASQNMGLIKDVLQALAIGAVVVAAAYLILNINTIILTVQTWLLNAALLANPIVWIIGLVFGLIAAIVLLWNRSETFRGSLYGLWASFKEVFMAIWGIAKDILGGIGDMIMGIVELDTDKLKAGAERFAKGIVAANPIGFAVTHGKNIAQKFGEGYEEGAKEVRDKLAGEKFTDNQSANSLSGLDIGSKNAGANAGAAETDAKINQGLSDVSGGGKSVRNVTVNITKLVESININTTNLKEGSAEIKKQIEEYLLRAIQGSEIALSNE